MAAAARRDRARGVLECPWETVKRTSSEEKQDLAGEIRREIGEQFGVEARVRAMV